MSGAGGAGDLVLVCIVGVVERSLLAEPCRIDGDDAAKVVGKVIAERAVEKGIKDVTFDRSGFKYHGRVAALADAAREAGLQF